MSKYSTALNLKSGSERWSEWRQSQPGELYEALALTPSPAVSYTLWREFARFTAVRLNSDARIASTCAVYEASAPAPQSKLVSWNAA